MSGVLTAASATRAAAPPDDLELLPQHADETKAVRALGNLKTGSA